MSIQPREALVEIVAKYGEPLLTAPGRCEGLLKDYCGEFRREIFVLVSCLRVGVVEQLRQQSVATAKQATVRLAQKMEQNLAVSGDIARWAVESWAIAMRLLDPKEAVTPSSCPAPASTPAVPAQPAIAAPLPVEEQMEEAQAEPEEPEAPVEEEIPVEEESPSEFIAQIFQSNWELPDWSQPEGQMVVYPDSSGQKPTLRDAVREAVSNKRLILKPGIYKESLSIRRDLQIVGDGRPGEVIIDSLSSGSVIVLEKGAVLISNVTVRGVVGKDKKTTAAIEVKSGHLIMEDCHLTSEVSSIMEVKGPQSEVVLLRCNFHDGKAGGIIFQEAAIGYLEECNFYKNKLSHIAIGRDCSPIIFSCKISNALMAGVYVNEGGGGLIENCDIWSNAVAGMQLRKRGNPRVRHCRISLNGRYGVMLAEDAEGLFEDCQVFENAEVGITVGKLSRPCFARCKVFDNRGKGIDIIEPSESEFLECEIFDNEGTNAANTPAGK